MSLRDVLCASCRLSSGSNLAICLNHRPLFDEQKIDVEDVRHNDNYNIYCTDEIAARKFLSPSVLAWFDEQISDQGLCAYLKGNKLYISKYTNEYMFPVPDTKKKLNAWSVEKAALYLKDLSQEAKAMASVFSK